MTVYNLPNYASGNFDVGQAKLYLGTDGASPRDDIGAVKSISFQLNQDIISMEQGFPLQTIDQKVIRQSGTLSVEMYEIDPDNLDKALSNAVVATCTGVSVIKWGGSATMDRLTGKVVHTVPGGSQWQFKFWKMQVVDLPEIPFPSDDYRTLNVTFTLLDAATVWSGDTATSGGTSDGRYTWIEVHPSSAGETD